MANCNPNCPCGSQPGTCVFYTGAQTSVLGILTNTNLNDVVRIIDAALEDISSEETALTKSITINEGVGISITEAAEQTIASNPEYTISVPSSYVRGLVSGTGNISYNSSTGIFSTSLTQYTDEMAQDTIAALISAGTHTGISYSYSDVGNSLSSTVSTSYVRQAISMDNGLTYSNITGVGKLGGTLTANTTLDTGLFAMVMRGNTTYEYPYEFRTTHDWRGGTGITSFRGTAKLETDGVPNPLNTVRIGFHYTEDIYLTDLENTTGPELPGYFGDETIGYFIGTNLMGHGSFGFYMDESISKATGIIFHTKDTAHTDAVTLFGIPTSAYVAGTPNTLELGTAADYKILTARTDGDVKLWFYDNTRDDGNTTQALYTDADGVMQLGNIAIRTFTPTGSADAAGETGDVTYDNSFIYVKTAGGWARSALAAF